MQRYDLNKDLTQNFNVDVDNDADLLLGSAVYLFLAVKMLWYIKIGYKNENANFTYYVGLVDMELGL